MYEHLIGQPNSYDRYRYLLKKSIISIWWILSEFTRYVCYWLISFTESQNPFTFLSAPIIN